MRDRERGKREMVGRFHHQREKENDSLDRFPWVVQGGVCVWVVQGVVCMGGVGCSPVIGGAGWSLCMGGAGVVQL